MADPKLSLYEKLRGKRMHDIKLPNQSGVVDPRLPSKETGKRIRAGWAAVKPLLKRSVKGDR